MNIRLVPAGTNINDSNIHSLSIFSKVLLYQTFVIVVIIVKCNQLYFVDTKIEKRGLKLYCNLYCKTMYTCTFCIHYTVSAVRVFFIINNQVLNKIKIAVRILLQKGRKYDESMINV